MARGRKPQTVKVLTGRDTKLLRQLDRTGVASHEQANAYCGVSNDRLNKLEKSGYIRTVNQSVDGANMRIIQLDKIGREFCRETYDTKSFYHSQITHISHDLKVTEAYYNLPKYIQETWKHEAELVKEIYSVNPGMRGELKTCVDAVVKVEGKLVAIEVVGKSYTKVDIELKEEIATNLLHCERTEFI